MSLGITSTAVLLVDDEPEYLSWVVEFLASLGLKVEFAETLPLALEAIDKRTYRLILLDMNIPAGGAASLAKSPISTKYPGIVAAIKARSRGYGAHQVIAYTVHDDDAADAELAKLSCRYVLKGRPAALKAVVRASIKQRPPRVPEKVLAKRRKPNSTRRRA